MTQRSRAGQARKVQQIALLRSACSIGRDFDFSWGWIVLGLAILFFPLATELGAQPLNTESCYRVALPDGEFFWITSGSWSPGARSLLLADPLHEAILEVSYTGEILSSIKDLSSTTEGDSPIRSLKIPVAIRPTEQGYLILDEKRSAGEWKAGVPSAEILQFNEFREVVGSIQIEGRVINNDFILSRIYDWNPLGSGVLAFADMFLEAEPDRSRRWMSGFVYLGNDPGDSQILFPIATNAAVCHQYIQSRGYLATLGDTGYILFLNPEPTIVKLPLDIDPKRVLPFKGLRELPVPEDFRMRPSLNTQPSWKVLNGARKATFFYKLLESSQMAAGIYSWDNNLYLLAKSAAAEHGKTAWWAIRLDPDNGEELSRVRLPTDAANLTVVPGEFFALIEKGRVEGFGDEHAPYMDIQSVTLLHASWLENPSPSRLDNFARVQCSSLPQ